MAAGNFNACNKVTSGWEGGWSDHEADPGGKTMYGVTQATFDAWRDSNGRPRAPVRTLTRHEAEEIYYRNYWRPVGAEILAAGVDLATYDYGVNSGPARALKELKKADGDGFSHAPDVVKALCARRRGFVRALGTFKVFGRGWLNRIADIEARGVAMALRAAQARKADDLADEGRAAETAAKRASRQAGAGGAVATGTGGAGAAIEQAGGDQMAALVLIAFAAMAAAVVAWSIWRRKIEKTRAEAYAAVAAEIRP